MLITLATSWSSRDSYCIADIRNRDRAPRIAHSTGFRHRVSKVSIMLVFCALKSITSLAYSSDKDTTMNEVLAFHVLLVLDHLE